MKKVILTEIGMVVLLAVVMSMLLWKREAKDVPLTKLETSFTETQNLNELEKVGDMRLKRAFNLNAADYEEYIYFAPDNTMGVAELLLIKVKDESQKETILQAIEHRIDVQKTAFDGYGTDQTELLNHAEIYDSGKFIGLVISRDRDSWLRLIAAELEG